MDTLRIEAYAKINLGLTVFGRKADGYHDIEGIFQNVDIADILELDLRRDGMIAIDGDLGCAPSDSTVFKAARIFFKAAGLSLGASIRVEKHIPSGAGLGGAGSDAAAVLAGLNMLCGMPFSDYVLRDLAAQVASDVPFFISGGAAIVRGRGEHITPINARTDFGVLIVQPRWASSTIEAYRLLDDWRTESGNLRTSYRVKMIEGHPLSELRSDEELIQMYQGSLMDWNFENDFLPALLHVHEEYLTLIGCLREAGACHAGLTGSGSCTYGIFADKEKFESAIPRMQEAVASAGRKNTDKAIERLIPVI
ncbi:MAG: 4-(cytidine 5'-diphospho)-2-C-methyl-D-erythritol kinase, partial [Rectinema sp.]|nr:4-(cytidine 5'-diphospho)-2-C-methyl-D-erythritol kinase [Rectinema sp.]